MNYHIPEEVREIVAELITHNYSAYPVGGCVRDLILGRPPTDWDVATNATPEDIQSLFPESLYENQFGTVAVKTGSEDPTLRLVEVTTFRVETEYSDKRRPDTVTFVSSLEEDLSRRDFTVNAMALDTEKDALIDPYGGQKDLHQKRIVTVGDPEARFREDALRLMRAVRFATQLHFSIESRTNEVIQHQAEHLTHIAPERIRDELIKIIMTPHAQEGIQLLEDTGLLQYIVPELREGIDCTQNKHHIYTVWEHNLRALAYAADKDYDLGIRLAALLHDVGKPQTKQGEGEHSTFYNHEVVGAHMTKAILTRLKFPNDVIKRVVHLVRYHLFYYNVDEVTEAGVRRFLKRVGPERVDDLIKVREADRIGSGVPKAVPYKLRHLLFMIDKVRRDPISTSMLAIDGSDIMKMTNLTPGPIVGLVLHALMEEVLDDPSKNTREHLSKRVQELIAMPEHDLQQLADKGKEKTEEFERGIEKELKRKHYVK